MKNRIITIKDIAKALGISASTVSRALKDHPDIAPETKKQVNELAKKLNYRPNPIALSLRNQRSNIVAVIVPEIVHHFFSSVISGIETAAERHNLQVLISQSFESYEREKLHCEIFKNSFIEGIIMSVSKETQNQEHIQALIDTGIPVIFFDRIIDGMNIDQIVINDNEGAFMATQHLVDQGCRKIVHLAGPSTRQISINRTNGYKRAIQEAGLTLDEKLIIECDTYEKAQSTIDKLLKSSTSFDGIFAVNDLTAIGAMNRLLAEKISIPEQIAIVGFGNDPVAEMVNPSLTSINQPGREMGEKAMEMFLNRIENGDNAPFQKITLDTNLIVRQSSMRH